MHTDHLGNCYLTEDDVIDVLYKNPETNMSTLVMDSPDEYNRSVIDTCIGYPKINKYVVANIDKSTFDKENQKNWFMPEEYKQLDIIDIVISRCKNEKELLRASEELFAFQELDKIDLLKYMVYMVDTAKKNGVLLGVGRGSSVASFVLYLLGVHRINPILYNIPMTDFIKEIET